MISRNIIILMACVFMLGSLNGCGSEADRKVKYLESGKAYLEKNDYDKARIEFKNVLQIDPKSADAYFYVGKIEEKEKSWGRAFANYNKALELDPGHLGAREKLGRFYLLSDDLEKTAEVVKELYARDPGSLAAKNLNASIMYSKGDIDGAIKETNESLLADPLRWETAVYLSKLYIKKGDEEKAITVLKEAISRIPDNIPLRIELAYIYADKNELDEAAGYLRQTIAIEPEEVEHYLLLTAFYVKNNLLDKADASIRETIKKFPENEQPYVLLAKYLMENKKEDQAVQELSAAIKKLPAKYSLYLNLADVYKKINMLDKAVQTYRQVIELDGVNSAGLKARVRLANILLEQGNESGALAHVEDVLRESPNNYDALMFKGKLALVKNDFEAAVNSFRTVLKDQPNLPEVSVLLAEAHIRSGYPVLARDVLHKAIVSTSGDSGVMLALVRTIERLEGKSQALARLEKYFGENTKILEVLAYKAELQADVGDESSLVKTIMLLKELYPNNEIGYRMSGRYYLAKGDFNKALEEFRHNSDQFSSSRQVMSGVVMTYAAKKEYEEAFGYIRSKIENPDSNLFAQGLMADVYLSKKDNVGAINTLRKMIAMSPKWVKPYEGLVKLYMDNNDVVSAISILNSGTKSAPEIATFDFMLANIYEKTGKPGAAIQVFEGIIKKQGVKPDGLKARNGLALLLLKQQKIDEAKKLIYEVLIESPSNEMARYMKGRLALSEGDGQTAIDIFKDILIKKYGQVELYQLLAQGYRLTGQNDLALNTLKRGVEANPNSYEAHFNLAAYFHDAEMDANALDEVNRALNLSPNNYGVLKLKIGVLSALKRLTDLKQALLNFKNKFKNDAFGYYHMGELFLSEKNYKNALGEFNDALKLAPGAIEPFTGLIKAHIGLRQYDDAIGKVNERIKNAPFDSLFYTLLGEIYEAQAKPLEAEKAYVKAIEIKPDWPVPYEQMASLYLKKNNYKTAIKWLNDGLNKSTRKDSLYIKLANAYGKAGMIDDAKRVYQEMIDEYPANSKLSNLAVNNLAALLSGPKSDKESVLKAVAIAERFENSGNPYYLDTLGWATLKSGKKEEAVLILRKAVNLAPENPILQYHLGLAFYQNGDMASALTHLSNALASKEEFIEREHAKSMLERAELYGQ